MKSISFLLFESVMQFKQWKNAKAMRIVQIIVILKGLYNLRTRAG